LQISQLYFAVGTVRLNSLWSKKYPASPARPNESEQREAQKRLQPSLGLSLIPTDISDRLHPQCYQP
jgi:hypothetical protein